MDARINTEALSNLASAKNWSVPELARRLDLDYSYLFRILNGEKKGGFKLFAGLYKLCREESLDIEKFIFLDNSLSTNNTEHYQLTS